MKFSFATGLLALALQAVIGRAWLRAPLPQCQTISN